ncbi:caspase family protein [Mesorhizobium sp. INR15]|uniref:caspase family protein n=1 Tax=Mesorhizobium sp. INR15 TaxID=2654248 RepID=UPI0018968454|nr:caspase family protein [Mesorhizobium sp. INR15]
MGVAVAAALVLCLCALVPAQAEEPKALKGVALVIGEQNYLHLGKLTNPGNDAREIQKLLTDLGFEARLVADRDAKKLMRELQRFTEDAEGADVALLYYSGHGIEAGGENFLVPVDASVDALDDAEEKLVPLSGIVDKLKATVPVAIVLLDACRSNPFPTGASVRLESGGLPVAMNTRGLGMPRGAMALSSASATVKSLGTVLGFAAEPGKAALDGPTGGNSPYAAALLKHLSAMQGDEFGTVLRLVAEEVYLKTGGKQQPWVNESLRSMLYFGMPVEGPKGVDGEILTERRKLLLTISTLPSGERQQVETAAADSGVPMDALYGMLRALGSDVPDDPAKLGQLLQTQAEKVKALMAERQALKTTDPEIVRLSGLADKAVSEGALETAIKLHEEAKARVASLEGDVGNAEADVKARRIEFAEVYGKSAAAYQLSFDYLTAAADYEKAFQQVERWDDGLAFSYLNSEALSLYRHGYFKGDNAALQRAIDTYHRALRFASRDDDGEDWALAQNNLGVALLELGERERGTGRIEEALAAQRAALEFYSREKYPDDWALTQMDIGNILSTLGVRDGDSDKLVAAIAAYTLSLQERTRNRDPIHWARTQQNIGTTFSLLGNRKNDAGLLRQSIGAYRSALEEFTRDREPLEWANTQTNLGAALRLLGDLENNDRYLEQAAEAYRGALEERSREKVPLDWATTQNNLGNTLSALAKRRKDRELYQQSFVAYRAALEERTRERVPLDWAQTEYNLGFALQDYADLDDDVAVLHQSLDAYSAAMQEWTEVQTPKDWASTLFNMALVDRKLAERSADTALFQRSADAMRQTLRYYSRDRVPRDWASAQINLAYVSLMAGQARSDNAMLEQALSAYTAATEVYTPADDPVDWSTAKFNSGIILEKLGSDSNATNRLIQGVVSYRLALIVYGKDKTSADWAATNKNIGLLLQTIADRERKPDRWAEAASAFRAALSGYRRDNAPADWASMQFNIGYCLQQLGDATSDTSRVRTH